MATGEQGIGANAAVDGTTIPSELRAVPQWVAWRRDPNPKGGKEIKVPVDSTTGHNASVSNPATWGTFSQAMTAVHRWHLAGIGFVFTSTAPYFGIDLDDCIDDNGGFATWAWEIIESFGTYAEISPSGHGVKLIGRGKLPDHVSAHSKVNPHIEAYDHGRFFTITSNLLQGASDEIADCQPALDAFCATFYPTPPQPERRNGHQRGQFTFTEDVTDAAHALDQLAAWRCDEYGPWLQVGMALSQLGDVGLAMWEQWSKRSVKFGPEVCAEKWVTFKREDGVTLGSLIQWGREDNTSSGGEEQVEPETAANLPRWGRATVPVESDEWTSPAPFYVTNLPMFPCEALPSWVCDEVTALAEATQTPVDLPAMIALAVLGVTCQGKVEVCVRSDWTEPVNLFCVTALPSGSRKSSVVKTLTQPLEAYERDEASRLRGDVARGESHYKAIKARLDGLQAQAAKAKPDELAGAMAEAGNLAAEIAEMKIPTLPRFLADDVTPEKMASLLVANNGRMAVLSPEADLFDLMSGRYGNQPNFGVFLKGHSGDALRVDRIGRPPEFVEHPCLTLGLAVQPDVLRGLVATPSLRGRGLLARFLYSWPVSNLGARAVEAPPVPVDIAESYRTAVTTLLSMTPGVDVNERPMPHPLMLDPSAYRSLMDFSEWLEPQLGETGELGTLADWSSKLVGQAIRIAALHHMAVYHQAGTPWSVPVGLRSTTSAITIAHYLIAHARASFAEMGADPEVAGAKRILRWIADTDASQFSKRDVFNGTRGVFKRVEAMEPALSLLTEHGYIRLHQGADKVGPGRKASPIYQVNPLWQR